MPRMRRAAIERRQRTQLALGVWQWLQGAAYESLSQGTKWDLLILTTHERDACAFWRRICEAVESGEIEVSLDKVHRAGDEPLLADQAIARRAECG
jgi:hypothetical protein